ncbi:hypothetical protein TIFTF001_017408 [Ficus carica]|uniref:Uncharacterized protein n=1 Tax=Ficus carica TaxID=3494 RepID=A0AA88AAK5_FICCA|nr:hypothetical protein TIFTF001_017408 [Ficus carica]
MPNLNTTSLEKKTGELCGGDSLSSQDSRESSQSPTLLRSAINERDSEKKGGEREKRFFGEKK